MKIKTLQRLGLEGRQKETEQNSGSHSKQPRIQNMFVLLKKRERKKMKKKKALKLSIKMMSAH